MTYYKTIDGIRYDRQLLELAEALAKETPLDLIEIQQLWHEVSDGSQITPTEKLSLNYIQQRYSIDPEAMNWISQQLTPTRTWEDEVNSILQDQLDLPDLQWEIDQAQLLQALEGNEHLSTEKILSGVLQAILNNSLGYFALWHYNRNQDLQKLWINGGKLSLLDPIKDQHRLTPEFWKNEDAWLHFLLDLPAFSPTQLVIYIRLSSPSAYGFCKSLIKRDLALAASLDQIISQRLKYRKMRIGKHWEWAEEEEQNLTAFGLGWRDGLYLALSDGVHNQESDISFQTAFLWEEWFELEGFTGIREASQHFLRSASIHYIPRHYRALAAEDEILAQIPKEAKLDLDNFWYFLILSEKYPDRSVIAYCRKNGDGIEDAWHDLYLTVGEDEFHRQIDQVIKEEFGLPGLDIQIDANEFARQAENHQGAWRPRNTIFRQLFNCLLKDKLSDDSFLQLMCSLQGDLSQIPNAFSPQAKAKFYLNKGNLRLKSIEESESIMIENFWIFSLQIPALQDGSFEIYIPRNPDFEEVTGVPFNQMVKQA